VKQQREFFAKRLYISDNANLARLCLAIIAPVSPAHQDCEDVLYDLERARKGYRMSKNFSDLLRLWIREFQVGKRSTKARLRGDYWKTGSEFESSLHFQAVSTLPRVLRKRTGKHLSSGYCRESCRPRLCAIRRIRPPGSGTGVS